MTVTAKKGFWRYENTALVLLFCSVGFVFFDRLAVSFLFPFIAKDLSLSTTDLGIISSALGLTFALSGPVFGYTANSFGKKRSLILLILVFSVFSLLSGFVTGLISLLVFRAIMGVAEGPVLPISQSVMIVESSESRRGFNMGFIQSTAASVFGGILAPLIIVSIASAWGWRFGFYSTIVPGLVLVLVLWKWLREPREVLSMATVADKEQDKVKLRDVIKNRNIFIGMLIALGNITWYIMMVTFTPNFLITVRHADASKMTLLMVSIGIGGALWGFAVPAISGKIGRKPAMIIFGLVSIFSPLAILYLPTSIVLFMVVLILVHCGQGIIPIYMAIMPGESVPMKYVAAAVGGIIAVGEIFGGVIMPTVAGRLADTISPTAPFWIAAIGALWGVVLVFFMVETAPNKVKKRLGAGADSREPAVSLGDA